MSDSTDRFSREVPSVARAFPPLPWWLADRLLEPNETVDRVFGPRFNPPWERQITHPALFLVGLAVGGVFLAAGALIGGGPEVTMASILSAGAVFVGSVFVLGLSNGYFTRLVVTNSRILILQ